MADLSDNEGLSRRTFLSGTAGLVIGISLPAKTIGQNAVSVHSFEPNAFIRITPDNLVTVMMKHVELGQGVYTGLATLVAEELDADWAQMRAESAPINIELFKNLLIGAQSTGGSTAISNSFMQMRKAGATARAMLVAAAAQKWRVSVKEINVHNGIISHGASGQASNFGDLAFLAGEQNVPKDPRLKTKSQYKYIGKDFPKIDTLGKTDGSAKFTQDIYRDDMLVAVIEHSPKFGGKVATFDASETKAVKGVVDVKKIPEGVVIYAENTFAALKGRKALKVEWDHSQSETRSSVQILSEYRAANNKPGIVISNKGTVDAALASAKTIYESEYVFPFLAHATMETLDAVFEEKDGKILVWEGCQAQTTDHAAISKTLEVELSKVQIKTMLAGGSFGRRAQQGGDFMVEAAHAFDAVGRKRPMKFMWTRENDIRGGYYRPFVVHNLRGAVDETGRLDVWDHKIAAQSLIEGSRLEFLLKGGPDFTIVEGANPAYYDIPNHRVAIHSMKTGVPVLWWRSVGHTHTAFAVECFMDELLQKAGLDAVEGRLNQIANSPRDAAVLTRVAELADWGRQALPGHAFGVALHKSFGTFVAQIAEVSIENNAPRVHNVWAAVDCGQPVNPNVIKAQIEGGIGFGLGAALFNKITLGEGGVVEQSNFHDYRALRIHEMPEVHVSIIDSDDAPKGIGEPGTPPIAPAVANAVRRLTGRAVRQLPFEGNFHV